MCIRDSTGGDRLALGGALVAAQQLQHGVADPVEVGAELDPVSYTHLTLPTSDLV